MALTPKQIYDLNNMNVAAQNVKLGDLLSSGDGLSAQSDWYENNETSGTFIKNRPGGYYTYQSGYSAKGVDSILGYAFLSKGDQGNSSSLFYVYGSTTSTFNLESGKSYKTIVWRGDSYPEDIDALNQYVTNQVPGEYQEGATILTDDGGITLFPNGVSSESLPVDLWAIQTRSRGDGWVTGAIGTGKYVNSCIIICSDVEEVFTPVLEPIPAELTTMKGGYDVETEALRYTFSASDFAYDNASKMWVAIYNGEIPVDAGMDCTVDINGTKTSAEVRGDK